MNEWIEKSLIGRVRYTMMVLQEDIFQLPAKFTIHSRPSADSSWPTFRCQPGGDGPYLVWKTRTVFEVDGKEYNLRYSPAHSVGMGDYVFTPEVGDEFHVRH